jgi:hypothetical protein
MPPKKKSKPPSWVASTAAPPKPKVPRVTVLNQITSNDLKGIFFTVEGIDQTHFDKLATKNFSSWEDVRITLGVPVEVIVRLQDKLADLPQVRGWIEKPGDFPEESHQPVVSSTESESDATSAISKRSAAQGLTEDMLAKHKDKKHPTAEAMRERQVRNLTRAHAHLGSPSTVWCDMAA